MLGLQTLPAASRPVRPSEGSIFDNMPVPDANNVFTVGGQPAVPDRAIDFVDPPNNVAPRVPVDVEVVETGTFDCLSTYIHANFFEHSSAPHIIIQGNIRTLTLATVAPLPPAVTTWTTAPRPVAPPANSGVPVFGGGPLPNNGQIEISAQIPGIGGVSPSFGRPTTTTTTYQTEAQPGVPDYSYLDDMVTDPPAPQLDIAENGLSKF